MAILQHRQKAFVEFEGFCAVVSRDERGRDVRDHKRVAGGRVVRLRQNGITGEAWRGADTRVRDDEGWRGGRCRRPCGDAGSAVPR